MVFDWQHLSSAVGGAALLKSLELGVQFWKNRADHRLSAAALEASLREELRSERASLLRRLEGVEQDVDQWRRSYWQVVEEREKLKATVERMTAELETVNKRADDLEAQVRALKKQLARYSGAESESESVPVR